jgi:hypothetical protein
VARDTSWLLHKRHDRLNFLGGVGNHGWNVLRGFFLLVWLGLLGLILLRPFPVNEPFPGDDLIRNTIRLALLFYAAAATLMLRLRAEDWNAATPRGQLARTLWTLAWLAYAIHLAMAFHFAHGWSHAAAMRHTHEVSGTGEGIFVSHLFTVVWTLDVLSWWLVPARYAARSRWVDRLLHGFMLFVIFNATVVFESGLIRWAGAALFVWLGLAWLLRNRLPSTEGA